VTDHLLELQQKIRTGIPLSETMEFEIAELTPNSIRVQAPLAPNVNVHGTGFAGSIYSIAVLAGWALCTHIMNVRSMAGDLVVASAEIKYRAPVTGEILCGSEASGADCRAFQAGFDTNGKGRLVLSVEVGERPSAVLLGTYYAVAKA